MNGLAFQHAAPQRLQLSRAAGFKLQAHSRALNGRPAVKCDRTTKFGNPYLIGHFVDRKQVKRWGWEFSPGGYCAVCRNAKEAVERFEHCLLWDVAIHDWLREQLGGMNLACWCGPEEYCHVDPILKIVNATPATVNARLEKIDADILSGADAALVENPVSEAK
ncbi:MAG: DUF4326 domain-containing protein [Nitrobacter sp.]